MKNLISLSLLSLLISCAGMTPVNDPNRLMNNFKMDTACTEKMDIKTVGEFKNFLNQYNGGSYLFTCGLEKYACVVKYRSSAYDYSYNCKAKISHK